MNVTVTAKVKLYTDNEISNALEETAIAFSDACNEVSKQVFEASHMDISATGIHNTCYYDVRKKLKSQMACSVCRAVSAKYMTVNTQLKQKPYTFKSDGKHYSFDRDVEWLQQPIRFNKPFAVLTRNRDWSFVTADGETLLSIGTLGKRVKVRFNHHFDKVLFGNGKLGGAVLLKKNGNWYMHISVTYEVKDKTEFSKIIGHDRGIRFIVTSYDGDNTTFVNGCNIAAKRDKYQRTRASLQRKNTKGSRRVLKRISGRENRWSRDVNHCLTKTLASEPDVLHVLEDLTDVSFDNLHGRNNKELQDWTFYDFEQKLIYKVRLNGSDVIKVPAQYTSQRCPKCGHIEKSNRNHALHLFRCRHCGYTSNDDRIAAMNLYELGKRYLETGKLKGFQKQ